MECGTGLGSSGLWIARELKALGHGKLIAIESDADLAKQAENNFRQAGLSDYAEVRRGDPREVVKTLPPGVEVVFLQGDHANYVPLFDTLRDHLADNALVVASSIEEGDESLASYQQLVRDRYESEVEWFEATVPGAPRAALEITRFIREPDDSPK